MSPRRTTRNCLNKWWWTMCVCTRRSRLAALLALAACAAFASDQVESRRAARDVSADTDPNSDFWRGAPAIFAEQDGAGNPVPGYRTEIRSRWTRGNLYFLF